MKVKILKCTAISVRSWYKNHIGKVVEVEVINGEYYNMTNAKGLSINPILKEDCILIEEHRNKLINDILNYESQNT